MKVFEFIDIVEHFHQLVKLGCTGNSSDFAEKLGVSRATVYNIISELESYGIEIGYSHQRQTYYYLYPEKVQIKVLIGQL